MPIWYQRFSAGCYTDKQGMLDSFTALMLSTFLWDLKEKDSILSQHHNKHFQLSYSLKNQLCVGAPGG